MKNAREVAYDILSSDKYSGIELQKLNHRLDYAFITRLVYSVLQNYELCVFQTQDFLKKAPPKEIEIILAMSAAQWYWMDSVTDYALVNESVNLTKKINPSFSGLVNAVLKKMIKRPLQKSENGNVKMDLSINTSHPLWIVELLVAQYGLEEAKLILKHNNTEPPLDIRINPKMIDLVDHYPITKEKESYVASSEIFKTDALTKGLCVIQDRNSQKLVNEINHEDVTYILDACCAPGTKLTQLAIKYPEASIIGNDLHSHRIDLTQRLVDRWQINNIKLVTGDILDYKSDYLFDLILADVPCSGLGVMRRKPDIRRRIQPSDLDSLEKLQADILDHCASLLSDKGRLVYATCTLNKKENEKQIKQFLKRHPEFVLDTESTFLGHLNHGDSFYTAHLVRNNGIMLGGES